MARSYFDKAALEAKLAELEEEGSCPDWLISLCRELAQAPESIPVREDKHRYVVEYIYPH